MATCDYSDFNKDDLLPFEVDLEQAARLLRDCLLIPAQATEEEILSALIEAVKAGELKPKRGTLKYQWATPQPILDARDLLPWAKAAYLELDLSNYGVWKGYCAAEAEISAALDARLKALRVSDESFLAETIPHDLTAVQLRDRLIACLDENATLHKEKSRLIMDALANPDFEHEPDPRHRKTLLRIIGALADLAGIDDAMPPKTAAHAINSKLESMGQKGMKPDTIAAVVTAARRLANEAID